MIEVEAEEGQKGSRSPQTTGYCHLPLLTTKTTGLNDFAENTMLPM